MPGRSSISATSAASGPFLAQRRGHTRQPARDLDRLRVVDRHAIAAPTAASSNFGRSVRRTRASPGHRVCQNPGRLSSAAEEERMVTEDVKAVLP